jgi:hypothetical protein
MGMLPHCLTEAVEFWMKTTDQTATFFALPFPASGYWDLILFANDFYWQTAYNSSNLYQRSASSVTDGNWHHIACCRSGTDHRIFFDGTQQGATATDSTNYDKSDVGMVIGSAGGVGGGYSGHLDDIRITKGVARYTSNFTAPTAAFPDF